jgi:hypothetical protein
VYYLFDYNDTERLFGFSGDNLLLRDLGIGLEKLKSDPSLELIRYQSPLTDRLFSETLVRRWREEFQPNCPDYDIA